MSTTYPTSKQTMADVVDNVTTIIASHHNNNADTIEGLEDKVGMDSSAVATSHDYLLTHLPGQSANVDIGAFEFRAKILVADQTTGTAPLTITSTTVVDNLNVDQVDGKDSTDFVLADGSQALTANWDVGAYTITGTQFISDIATGTAPFTVASTTKVTNLQADSVDGAEASATPTNGVIVIADSSGFLHTPSAAPDADYEVSNKKYVDDEVAGVTKAALGSWVSGYSIGTEYTATTDGFVTVNANGDNTYFTINTPSATARTGDQGYSGAAKGFGSMCPVKSGDTWTVVGNASCSIYWIPLS